MADNRVTASPPSATSPSAVPQPAAPRLSPPLKIVLSALLAFHVLALVVCPWSIEGSPIAGRLWLVVQPYVQAAYLNHGYHFFAPQPGPSHRAGAESASSTSPDRRAHRVTRRAGVGRRSSRGSGAIRLRF